MSTHAGSPPALVDRDRTPAIFGQTMGLVGATALAFSAGAYVAQDAGPGWGWLFLGAALVCLFAMGYVVRRAADAGVPLLLAFGFLFGAALAPTLATYVAADPHTLVESAAATALFMAGFGIAGYSTRRDLSRWSRGLLLALIALIVLGIVQIFVQIPGGAKVYAVAGLCLFAALVAYDFQRLRREKDSASAPLLAASIFLDAFNVLQFFLIFRDGDR